MLSLHVHAPFLLQAVLCRRLAGSVGTVHGQLISAALAGYSALTGGYEGGQAEYARVIFGAATGRCRGFGTTCCLCLLSWIVDRARLR